MTNKRHKDGQFGLKTVFVLMLSFQSLASFSQDFKLAPIEESSPREDLRKKLFSARLNQRACEVLAKDPAATISSDPSLQTAVRGIIKSIQERDEKALREWFNPRLKVKSGQVLSSLSGLKQIVGGNANVTNYRTAALNSPGGTTEGIECEDTGVLMHPLYGYPLSVGLWLQATGEDEVARVFAVLVPDAKSWTIGAWHVQQWTHAGKEFSMWYDLATTEANRGRKAGAFIAADIASKLLDGGGFLVFPVKQDVDTFRDKQMPREEWNKVITASFPKDKVIYSSTLFARSGAAVLVRFGITEEMSAVAIKDHCHSRLQEAMKDPSWTTVVSGIRCGYNFPRETVTKEGVLGGIFVSKEDAAKPLTVRKP